MTPSLPPTPTGYGSALRILSWVLSTVATVLVVLCLWLPADWWRLIVAAFVLAILAAAASGAADEHDEVAHRRRLAGRDLL